MTGGNEKTVEGDGISLRASVKELLIQHISDTVPKVP